ncbi:hypothetical protein [Streptomyces sp. NPDC101206]|uniref:hypothetical protein n=1 Tax=Streptomyces sp. NPDC101206 TaxID=3366128 RepID=UPI00380B2CF1
MTLRPAAAPVTAPVAKPGGTPVWLGEPCWPVSPSTGEPLDLIGQFPVPGEPGDTPRLAYLFLAYDAYETGATARTTAMPCSSCSRAAASRISP